MYEFLLIIGGIVCALFVTWHKERKYLIPLYVFSLLVGVLLLWVDFHFDAVTYHAVFKIPSTKYPVSIICIAGIYIFGILILQEIILKKIKVNKVLKLPVRLFVIALLNLGYSLLDFIIVRTHLCVFRDNNVNIFYNTLDFTYLPLYYYWGAYKYFFMGILLSGLLYLAYSKLKRMVHYLKNKESSHKKN